MATPFIVGPVEFGVTAIGSSSIFADVEDAKRQLLEIRKSSRNRLEAGYSSRAAQSTSSASTPTTVNRDLQNYRATLRLLLESESQLAETRSRRSALEKRRESLRDAILSLRSEIELANVQKEESASEEGGIAGSGIQQPDRKRQRYFDSSEKTQHAPAKPVVKELSAPVDHGEPDDLSTVVCPFELLGRCTDPTCPHMHLDR